MFLQHGNAKTVTAHYLADNDCKQKRLSYDSLKYLSVLINPRRNYGAYVNFLQC